MRLITWNCQGAYRKKADYILKNQPDILIIQECENLDKLKLDSQSQKPNDYFWYGDNANKGIGIFSYSDYKFKLLPVFNPIFRYIIPLQVSNEHSSFTLFAIWAMNNKENRDARYIGQIWLAINYYESLLKTSIILIGDFNSNKIWDYKDRVGNHSDVVKKLSDQKITSVYHNHLKIEQGKEQHPTFFLQKNISKPYHIDYCFASIDIMNKVNDVEIGKYEDWKLYSDHSPLIISFDDFSNKT